MKINPSAFGGLLVVLLGVAGALASPTEITTPPSPCRPGSNCQVGAAYVSNVAASDPFRSLIIDGGVVINANTAVVSGETRAPLQITPSGGSPRIYFSSAFQTDGGSLNVSDGNIDWQASITQRRMRFGQPASPTTNPPLAYLFNGEGNTTTVFAGNGLASFGGSVWIDGGLTVDGGITTFVGVTSNGGLTVLPYGGSINRFTITNTGNASWFDVAGVLQEQINSTGATFSAATVTGNFSVDSPTFVVNATTNRVGVGTASPQFDFQVSGSGSAVEANIVNTNAAAGNVYARYAVGNSLDPEIVSLSATGQNYSASGGYLANTAYLQGLTNAEGLVLQSLKASTYVSVVVGGNPDTNEMGRWNSLGDLNLRNVLDAGSIVAQQATIGGFAVCTKDGGACGVSAFNAFSATCDPTAACGEDSNFLGPVTRVAGSIVDVSCSWGIAGTGGTTGVVAQIYNSTDSSSVCTCTLGACTVAARTPVQCSCTGTLASNKTYTMRLSSTTDCILNPQAIYCNVTATP